MEEQQVGFDRCKEIMDSNRYKSKIDKGWELDPDYPQEGNLVKLRIRKKLSINVRFPSKELE